jgi:F-type H+-transporting ATPase subunit delta
VTSPPMTDESKLNVTVLEAVSIDDLDPEAVKTGLAQYTAAYASATEDLAKTEAEIGVSVYQAMSYAIDAP